MATRTIINGSVINYQVSFDIPDNTVLTGVLIRDDLPSGLTYAKNTGASWVGTVDGDINDDLSTPYAAATTDPVKAEERSRVQLFITGAVVQTEGTYTINIPAKVVDSTKLVTGTDVTNEFTLYSSIATPAEQPAITENPDTATWTPATPDDVNDSSDDTFQNYQLIVKGDLQTIENAVTTGSIIKSGYDFNMLNTLESSDPESTLKYVLTATLNSHFTGISTSTDDATAKMEIFYLNGEARTPIDKDTITVKTADGKQYVIEIPVADLYKGRTIHVYVPFDLTTKVTDDEFGTANTIDLQNLGTVEVQNDNGTVVVKPVSAYADIIVNKEVVNPGITFHGKSLN